MHSRNTLIETSSNAVDAPIDLTDRSGPPDPAVALLTGGWDRPYAFGLTTALFQKDVHVDLICGDDLNIGEFHRERRVTVFNFRRDHGAGAGLLRRMSGILLYYARLVRYAWSSTPRVFHILWNNKFAAIDRVVLMLYYRLLGKRIVLTAHNVNAGQRDGTDTLFNRLTLKCQYRLADHIFVHTAMMKGELVEGFGIPASRITVIRFGINNSIPQTALTRVESRQRLGIEPGEKAILFFGNIAPYKGLEYLIAAFRQIAVTRGEYRLIVAGRAKAGSETYWNTIKTMIGDEPERDGLILKIEFIPDAETEVYFKAADVLVLPYVHIFQSGVLFLAYSFGLPVLTADVGSLKEDIVEGENGFVFASRDSDDLARTIKTYFDSDLFRDLERRRPSIRDDATARYSWDTLADVTRRVYRDLLAS